MKRMHIKKLSWLRLNVLLGSFAFLYLPMLILVIYSFNDSRLVTVWGGWSVRWYSELFRDDMLMQAVGLSLFIAVCAASAAVMLGTASAFVLARFGRFSGMNSFAFMNSAPLVMPEVITGLSLLLLFVAMGEVFGWPQNRGTTTIWIAHVTLCTAYVTVVVCARLREFDKTLEEAAMDLGARPLKVFFVITLPLITPAIAAGWLLAFTLSLDDLVIASFVSGPNASTLPMVVFGSVRQGVNPKFNALATIFIAIVSAAAFLGWLFVAQRDKRDAQARAMMKKREAEARQAALP